MRQQLYRGDKITAGGGVSSVLVASLKKRRKGGRFDVSGGWAKTRPQTAANRYAAVP